MSPTSINRYRNEIFHFDFLAPKIKQFLKKEQMNFRKLFSYSILASKNERTHIIFTDESRFCNVTTDTGIGSILKNKIGNSKV